MSQKVRIAGRIAGTTDITTQGKIPLEVTGFPINAALNDTDINPNFGGLFLLAINFAKNFAIPDVTDLDILVGKNNITPTVTDNFGRIKVPSSNFQGDPVASGGTTCYSQPILLNKTDSIFFYLESGVIENSAEMLNAWSLTRIGDL